MTAITSVTVQGMTCGHCTNAVETGLARIHGVTAVHAELETGVVTITSDTDIDAAAVAAAVDEAGYQVAP